jgi:flagellar secretion chaperone FliS
MWNTAHDAYLETRVLAADPLELVRILYRAAITATRDARNHLAAGDIAARSKSISKVCDILIELSRSLDPKRGGEIGTRLAALYDYMQRRMIEANCQQSDPPLAEVLALLSTLSEGWEGITQPEIPAGAPANPWAVPAEIMDTYVGQGWSA